MLRQWLQDARGGTAIEYALIAALFAITGVMGALLVSATTKAQWESVSEAVAWARNR